MNMFEHPIHGQTPRPININMDTFQIKPLIQRQRPISNHFWLKSKFFFWNFFENYNFLIPSES